VTLLVALLEMPRAPRAEAAESMSHDVAWNTDEPWLGRGIGDSSPSLKAAMGPSPDLDGHGFAARAEEHDLEQSVVSDNCPFGAAAQHHRCCAPSTADHRGHARRLGPNVGNVTLTSRARGDDACR